MILVVDSGSTKTIWKCSNGAGKVLIAKTGGINPYYNNKKEILSEVSNARLQLSATHIDEIYFYGAGCATDIQKEIVRETLLNQFGSVVIIVNNDLLGAARSLFQESPGIACILGTGSGSCIYDGHRIVHSIPSLGFIMGDEGSGAFMGKHFVRDFLREDMPFDLIEHAAKDLGITKEEVLKNVNNLPMPSRYLAGFSKFIYENLDHKYMHDLVYFSLEEFVRNYIVRYSQSSTYSVSFVGSIAVKYNEILKEVFDKYNLLLGKICKNPIDGLIEFHLSKEK